MVLGVDWAPLEGTCSGSLMWLLSDGGQGWRSLEGFIIHVSGIWAARTLQLMAGSTGATRASLSPSTLHMVSSE